MKRTYKVTITNNVFNKVEEVLAESKRDAELTVGGLINSAWKVLWSEEKSYSCYSKDENGKWHFAGWCLLPDLDNTEHKMRGKFLYTKESIGEFRYEVM